MLVPLLVTILLASPPQPPNDLSVFIQAALTYHALDGPIDTLSSSAAARNWLPEVSLDADYQRTDGLDQDKWHRFDREDTILLLSLIHI